VDHFVGPAPDAQGPAHSPDDADADPFLWLEDVTGTAALDWVRERNAAGMAALAEGQRFAEMRDAVREVLDSQDRIPYAGRRGEYLYNFWQDAANPRGLWRRTTLAEYRKPEPDWDVLLDLDALAASEGENWVWQGAAVLRPGGYRLALISLSRGGADASVIREFDLESRAFVPDGFAVPEAKTDVSWISADQVYIGTDFGPGSLTSSGYPRIVKQWRRDTDLSEAAVVYEGEPDDVSVGAYHDPTEGFERDFVVRHMDFYRSAMFLRVGDDLVQVPVPDDALVDVHREWLLVQTRSPWTVGGTTHPAGVLLAARFADFMAGDRELTTLFEPDAHTSLSYFAWTRHHLILGALRDVRSELTVLTPDSDTGQWRPSALDGVPEFAQTDVAGTDPLDSDEYQLISSGFTEPATLRYGHIGAGPAEPLKQAPAFFDATGMSVEQFFAISADSTPIPYFVVRPGPGHPQPGPAPTLLTGYGGFEVSLTPSYSGVIGRGWLARGGTYVVANLRGGGEYGPQWHLSAIKEHRHRVYEDFAAVATDLVNRGITSPGQLGIEGGSNGGLLMGVMLTRYPELFGAIVGQVPLLDMRRYNQLLAGASWIAEYGDPGEEDEWAFLRPYSPYQNAAPDRRYPPVLFITSTRDDRVHPGHARKMVARLLEQGHDVSYYENIEGGHGAAADNEQRALKWALVFEFLWQRLAG
jgi:prolyl oligopeptidase